MAKENPLASNLTLEQQKNLFGNAYLNMLWHCPTDQRFPYWVHLPDCYYDEKDPHYKLLVIIHGTGCAVEDYVRHAKELADRDHVAVLAPLFPGGLIQRDDFNSYKLLSCDGVRYDQILLDMIDDRQVLPVRPLGRRPVRQPLSLRTSRKTACLRHRCTGPSHLPEPGRGLFLGHPGFQELLRA